MRGFKEQTELAGFIIFFSRSPLPYTCLHSRKQYTLMRTETTTSDKILSLQFFFQCFSFLFSLCKTLTLLIFFSLLSPFRYPSVESCATSYKVIVVGLCQEVHPALYNAVTFCPLM